MSITEGWEKINSETEEKDKNAKKRGWLNISLIIAIILLISSASFGLGRLSALEEKKMPVRIEYDENLMGASVSGGVLSNGKEEISIENKAEQGSISGEGIVVGSKNSSVYHFPWCSGAQRISEQNRIYFNSIEEARAAGYRPAANCRGLE
jgi:hypothetical protein